MFSGFGFWGFRVWGSGFSLFLGFRVVQGSLGFRISDLVCFCVWALGLNLRRVNVEGQGMTGWW